MEARMEYCRKLTDALEAVMSDYRKAAPEDRWRWAGPVLTVAEMLAKMLGKYQPDRYRIEIVQGGKTVKTLDGEVGGRTPEQVKEIGVREAVMEQVLSDFFDALKERTRKGKDDICPLPGDGPEIRKG